MITSKRILSFWYEPPSIKSRALSPLSFLFRLIVRLRRYLYSFGIFKTKSFTVPVVVVGNLTVGGTGKTPLTIHLCKLLRDQGYKPGIVSRGYGGKNKNSPILVDQTSDIHRVGDEPYLIAERTKSPVVVCRKRIQGVNYLLNHCDVDVVLSDDGLQHYAMNRDLEIIVVDGNRRFGNKQCLPVGPLREPLSRLDTVDFVVNNGRDYPDEYKMELIPDVFYQLTTGKNSLPDEFNNKIIHAVAGIGSPERFFTTLRELGLVIIEHTFPDHYQFTQDDLQFEDGVVVITEKDAVKCKKFAQDNVWVLRVRVEENFSEELLTRLKNVKNRLG